MRLRIGILYMFRIDRTLHHTTLNQTFPNRLTNNHLRTFHVYISQNAELNSVYILMFEQKRRIKLQLNSILLNLKKI